MAAIAQPTFFDELPATLDVASALAARFGTTFAPARVGAHPHPLPLVDPTGRLVADILRRSDGSWRGLTPRLSRDVAGRLWALQHADADWRGLVVESPSLAREIALRFGPWLDGVEVLTPDGHGVRIVASDGTAIRPFDAPMEPRRRRGREGRAERK